MSGLSRSGRIIFRAMVSAGADFIELAFHDAAGPVLGHNITLASVAKQTKRVGGLCNVVPLEPEKLIL